MAPRFEGERTLTRICIGESGECEHGKYEGLALHEALRRLCVPRPDG